MGNSERLKDFEGRFKGFHGFSRKYQRGHYRNLHVLRQTIRYVRVLSQLQKNMIKIVYRAFCDLKALHCDFRGITSKLSGRFKRYEKYFMELSGHFRNVSMGFMSVSEEFQRILGSIRGLKKDFREVSAELEAHLKGFRKRFEGFPPERFKGFV